jgi:hypothetical protein
MQGPVHIDKMSLGLLERSSKLVTEAKQSCSSAMVHNGKQLASDELHFADTHGSTATAVIDHATCNDTDESTSQQQQQQRQRPATTIGITYHYSRTAATGRTDKTHLHRHAGAATEVPGYSSTINRDDRVFDDAVTARAAALKSVEREWEDEIAVNILSLYQTKVAGDVKKHIEQQQQQQLHLADTTNNNSSSGTAGNATAQHVRSEVYLTQRQERELQHELEAEQQTQQQQQQRQQLQQRRSPSRSPQRSARDADRNRCVSLQPLSSTATTANSGSLTSSNGRKVTANTREQRAPIAPIKPPKLVAKPIVIPVRPAPIWFAGTGAVHAEWNALPGGRDVKRQLQTLEDQGELSVDKQVQFMLYTLVCASYNSCSVWKL